jgi:Ca2+-binding RTX toxin-like protein
MRTRQTPLSSCGPWTCVLYLRGSPRANILTAGRPGDPTGIISTAREAKTGSSGGFGPDRLIGGTGADRLFGQGGADILDGQQGRDLCGGGKQKDKARNCERLRRIP